MRKYILLFLLLQNIFLLANPTKLSQIEDFKNLEGVDFKTFEDTNHTFGFEEIQKLDDSLWIEFYYFKNLESVYWIRYEITNDVKEDKKWVLELIDPHINEIEFYSEKGQLIQKQGFLLDFGMRKYLHKNHVFDISIPKGETRIYYCKLKSKSQVAFSAKLQTNDFFTSYSLNEYFFLGLFYGFMLIMIAYNLILYLFTRMDTRIYYALYVVSAALNSVAEDGLGFQYLWPDLAWANTVLPTIQPLLFLYCFLIYTFNLLEIKKGNKLTITILYVFVYTMYHVACSYNHIPTRFWVPFYIVPFAFVLWLSIKSQWDKKLNTRLLTIGTSLIFISYFIFYLRTNAWIDNSIYVVYFFNFSVTIEAILFSIAIGDKLRAKQIEHLQDKESIILGLQENEKLKDKVNRELEQKVAERTKELEVAKSKLEQQAHEITEMNLKLDLSNRDLSKKVVEVSKKRIHGIELDPEEFHELYPDKTKCFQLLEEIKWSAGYNCRKCENDTFNKGTTFKSRRCTKCGNNETPTSNTIFHGLRTPIHTAFYIFALVVRSKGKISSSDLEKKTGVNQKVCWSLKQKIVERIEEQKNEDYSWKSLISNEY